MCESGRCGLFENILISWECHNSFPDECFYYRACTSITDGYPCLSDDDCSPDEYCANFGFRNQICQKKQNNGESCWDTPIISGDLNAVCKSGMCEEKSFSCKHGLDTDYNFCKSGVCGGDERSYCQGWPDFIPPSPLYGGSPSDCCRDESDCRFGELCLDSICWQECNYGCSYYKSGSYFDYHCNEATNVCAPGKQGCSSDADCSSDEHCYQGQFLGYPDRYCKLGRKQCASDSDCNADERCESEACQSGQRCDSQESCPDDKFCYRPLNSDLHCAEKLEVGEACIGFNLGKDYDWRVMCKNNNCA